MDNIRITNLNNVRHISLIHESSKNHFFSFYERKLYKNFWYWVIRKSEKKKYIEDSRWIDSWFSTSYSIENFEKENNQYYIVPGTETIVKKAHVKIIYESDSEIKFFDNNKEAEEYFNKLRAYVHENNLPFINLNYDQLIKET